MVVRVGVRLARYVLHYKQLNQTLERPGLSGAITADQLAIPRAPGSPGSPGASPALEVVLD